MSTQHEGQAGPDGAWGELSGISDDELSGGTSDETTVATILQSRIAIWQYQLLEERPTPLLQKELQRAIKEMSEALKQPTFPAGIDLESLDAQHKQISKHWGKLFKHPCHRTLLLTSMTQYEVLFAEMLLEDYASQPARMPLSDEWLLDRVSQVLDHREASGHSKSNDKKKQKDYHEYVILPLEEMSLGGLVSHAEKKLCAAVVAREDGSRGPGGYVSQLIQRCDWEKLAEALVYDRRLAVTLFSFKPISRQRSWEAKLPRVLQKMDDLERTYFTNLSSPSNYTISKHASDLLARHSSNKSNHVPLPRMPAAEKHAHNMTNTIKNRLRLLTTGLTLRTGRDPATSSARSDEYGPLLYQDEQGAATSGIRSDEKGDLMSFDEKEV